MEHAVFRRDRLQTGATRLSVALLDQLGTTVKPGKLEVLDIDDTFGVPAALLKLGVATFQGSQHDPGVTTQATSPRRAIAEARPQVPSLSSTSPIMSVTSSSPSS